MKRALAFGIVGAAVATAACSEARSENGGPTVDRSYTVGDFDKVELAGAYDADIRVGGAPSVKASGSQKAIDDLEVVVENGALVLRHKKKMNFGWSNNHGKIKVVVTVPALRAAELSGSGDLRVDKVTGDAFDAGIAGSGNLTVGNVAVNRLKMSVAGSGNAEATGGRAKAVEYNIAGSGGINAKGVAAETAAASIAGSGNIDGQATATASVNIMGSGNVNLTGGAKCTVSKAGSGNANCS